jgi:hypothetical protein
MGRAVESNRRARTEELPTSRLTIKGSAVSEGVLTAISRYSTALKVEVAVWARVWKARDPCAPYV